MKVAGVAIPVENDVPINVAPLATLIPPLNVPRPVWTDVLANVTPLET